MRQDFVFRRMFTGQISDKLFNFHVQSMTLTLASEDNLWRWHIKSADWICRVIDPDTNQPCGRKHPTAPHVLACCDAVVHQGWYTWRHDSVLLAVKEHLIRLVAQYNSSDV